MTQEDKELLLKDLCARLPYRVICHYEAVIPLLGEVLNNGPLQEIRRSGKYFVVNGADCLYGDIKPYLRPMSSMTEEEKRELLRYGAVNRLSNEEVIDVACVGFENHANVQDWLNSYHFDYRGLIQKGLALEAPEGMYK